MLHQYTDPPFTDLGNHYSTQLNSCSSYLLNQSCAETSEANDLNNEENDFLKENDICMNEYNTVSFHVDSVIAMDKDAELQSSDEVFEDTVMKENSDHNTNSGEPNNNVPVEDMCKEAESIQKDNEMVPLAVVESEGHLQAHKNGEGWKEDMNPPSSTDIGCELCDENESTFRLPGFHQAFGSTEIGRFVHQKDFIEQINQQTSFTLTKSLPISSLPVCSSSPTINNSIISHSNSPKIRSRYNKRLKVPAHSLPPPPPATLPPPTDISRNMLSSWSDYEYDLSDPTAVNPAMNFQSTNCNGSNNYYNNRHRDTRAKRSQYGSTGMSSSYNCNGDNYYNCSSSYYYGGSGNGYSESMNCDYYRYQQNSSYYNNGYSTYSNLHNTGYANGYHYSKDHSERYNSMISGSHMTCGMNQNCPIDKYSYSSYNEEQIPYHYGDKQSNTAATYHQYQQYMPHNQHQLPSQPNYNNYYY